MLLSNVILKCCYLVNLRNLQVNERSTIFDKTNVNLTESVRSRTKKESGSINEKRWEERRRE